MASFRGRKIITKNVAAVERIAKNAFKITITFERTKNAFKRRRRKKIDFLDTGESYNIR